MPMIRTQKVQRLGFTQVMAPASPGRQGLDKIAVDEVQYIQVNQLSQALVVTG